jgi:hypothetical protein
MIMACKHRLLGDLPAREARLEKKYHWDDCHVPTCNSAGLAAAIESAFCLDVKSSSAVPQGVVVYVVDIFRR